MKDYVRTDSPAEITALQEGFMEAIDAEYSVCDAGMAAVANVYALTNPLERSVLGSGQGSSPAPQQAQIESQPSAPVPPIFASKPGQAEPAKSGGGSPMGFFKKPGEGQAPADPAVTRPVNWSELESASETIARQPRPKLDPETERILREAGEAARDALFGKRPAKDKPNPDKTNAAE